MIVPCIDLMDGKVVQLVQARDKAFEGEFAAFPEIQVIDLDAAMGRFKEELDRRGIPVRVAP